MVQGKLMHYWSLGIIVILLGLPIKFDPGKDLYSTISSETEVDEAASARVVIIRGTGRTTGHVVTCIVDNDSDDFLAVMPQTMYVPSDGKFQDYIVSIPDGIILPPNTVTEVPGIGYCGSARKPPSTGKLPDPSTWVLLEDPQGPYISNLPVSVLTEGQQIDYAEPPVVKDTISLIPGKVLEHTYATAHPGMEHLGGVPRGTWYISDDGAHRSERADEITTLGIPDPYVLTVPGTEVPITGYFTEDIPDSVWAPILLDVVRKVEQTVPEIQSTGLFPTPFSADPVKEMDATTQQVIWIYTSGFFGNDYTKDEFVERTYKEAEASIGVPVEDLPAEQQTALKTGVDQFWATYTATGLAAKLIDPKTDMSSSGISSEGQDYLYNLTIRKKQGCKCDSMSYKLLVERGGLPIINNVRFNAKRNPRIYVDDLAYGEDFYVLISEINVDCTCGTAACQCFPEKEKKEGEEGRFFDMNKLKAPFDREKPGQVDINIQDDAPPTASSTGNLNCKMTNGEWLDEDRSEFGFTLAPVNEKTKNPAIFQRFQIVTWCDLEDCLYSRCSEYVTITFVNIK